MRDDSRSGPSDLTRRAFLSTAGASAAAAVIAGVRADVAIALAGAESPAAVADGPNIEGAVPVTLRINGKEHQLRIDPRTTLLDCLRETVAPHRHEEGLRPRAVRRLHGARERPARELVPEPGR